MTDKLYFGDNLPVLRQQIADASVDLIYLDPPFNSKRDYNLLFKAPKASASKKNRPPDSEPADADSAFSDAQIIAFEDTWHWGQQAEDEFREILQAPNTDVSELMRALRAFLKENDMMAYLTAMCVRLLELHRVLKPTGSLYLHCDPTASHYLKIVLDAVFGQDSYRNEITWKRTTTHSDSKSWSRVADTLFFYTKTSQFTWNAPRVAHSDAYRDSKYRYDDSDGRGLYRLDNMTSPSPRPNMMYEWLGFPFPEKGWRYERITMQRLHDEGRIWYPATKDGQADPKRRPQLKRYLNENEGGAMTTVWTDISPINSQAAERLGYPTQKPLALLERIIEASSNEGDVVLDPFCGCGTAVHAAHALKRRWVGIDITHLAVGLIERRLKNAFADIRFDVLGTPRDLQAARNLAERDKHQFQLWACSLVNAQPYQGGKKGADGGIDGMLFVEVGKNRTEKIIVQVKGGAKVQRADIATLKGDMERAKAAIGLFVTLAEPTRDMLKEAAAAGHFESPHHGAFARIQILSIESLLSGQQRPLYPDLSYGSGTFKPAKAQGKKDGQNRLF